MVLPESECRVTESRMVDGRAEGKEKRDVTVMGTEFPFGKTKKFWRRM